MTSRRIPSSVSAKEALKKLRDGNHRFIGAERCMDTYLSHTGLGEDLEGQSPTAIVPGCSDSRVPVELVLDVGLGDVFVIRVAENVVAPSVNGSVELAAAKFGSRLVVVLGHPNYGAITTTIESMNSGDSEVSENIESIVARNRPSVEKVLSINPLAKGEDLINLAVRTKVRSTVERLRHGSDLLEKLTREEGLVNVGAENSLATGQVDFFDGVQAASDS